MTAWCLGAWIPVLARYQALRLPNGLDQGYFLQRVWLASTPDEPIRTLLNTEQGHGLMVGRHFEPILALFVPWVSAWPDHRTLLFGQLVLLGLSLPFVWRLARLHLSGGQAILATWAWLGMPVLWQIEAQGFRTIALATPFVVGCLWAASSGRTIATLLMAIAALACREEVVWALLAALPWVWAWRGRVWRDTSLVLGGVCALWLGMLALVYGGPSTYWRPNELLGGILAGLEPGNVAWHTSPGGALRFMGGWLGPGVLATMAAPLAALPLVAWWLGIQAVSGLAGPEAVHLLAPAAGVMALVLPLGLGRLPRSWVTPILLGLVLWGGIGWTGTGLPQWQAWLEKEPAPAGDVWGLIDHIPREAAVLSEARFLPALAARERIYATEDWREPSVLEGHFEMALLREKHPWRTSLADQGFRVSRVCPGVNLWKPSTVSQSTEGPITPK